MEKENKTTYSRAEIIRLLGLGVPGILFGSSLLSSCSKYPLPDSRFSGTVGIIGGGIAGLYAGYLLQQQGISYRIYEASDRIGGRVFSEDGIVDHSVEWGASIVEGENHALFNLMTSNGAQWIDATIQDYAFVEGYWLSEEIMKDQLSMKKLDEVILGLRDYQGADMNANLYASNQGVPVSTLPVWNARLGIRNGATTDIMGILGITSKIQNASSGTAQRQLLNGSLSSIILSSFQDLSIQLQTPVASIDYSSNLVQLTDTNGNTYAHDKVIVTAPISILKSQINFNPALPSAVASAIDGIAMRPGMQVLLEFNQRFWEADARRLQMDGLCPNFEVIGSGGRSATNHSLMANLFGTAFEDAQVGPTPVVAALLQQLDNYFGNSVATNSLLQSRVHDWSQDQWIQGIQSYSPVGASTLRYAFVPSIEHKISWAGEATHPEGHHGTLHGAMETAARAVQQIMTEV
jgi:monoamine oxidase